MRTLPRHLRAQLEMLSVLQVVIRAAQSKGLRALDWTVDDLGTGLVGRVSTLPDHLPDPATGEEDWTAPFEPAESTRRWQRETFDGYAAIIEELHRRSVEAHGVGGSTTTSTQTAMERWEHPIPDTGGGLRLHATARWIQVRTKGGRVDLTVPALMVIAELCATSDA